MEGRVKKFSFLCDFDGKIIRFFDDSEELFSEDAAGSLFFSRVVPDDLDKILNFFIELKSQGSAIGWDINVACADGPATFSFFGGVFGEFIGIAAATTANGAKELFADMSRINNEQVNILRNVTKENARLLAEIKEPEAFHFDELTKLNNELVNIQRELAKKNQELDHLNKQKNQFLGIAAHDLRNPLGIILGFTDLMKEDPAGFSEAEFKDMLDRIHAAGKFMLGLITDLLDIANIESGSLELHLADQDLDAVLKDNIAMNSLYTRARQIQINYTPPTRPVFARIDRDKIDQAVTNYLTNAVRYSFPGSEVEITLETTGRIARIMVSDHGQGIRENELGKLFNAFQRASTRSTSGEPSTGLGLYIVKKIIETHGGEVGVHSIFGQGSRFWFTLPVNRDLDETK
jgi:signal transduction histidine kinase